MSRLQDLRDAIWLHGPEHFNMSTYGDRDINSLHKRNVVDPDSEVNPSNVETLDLTACGTACCIAGHGAILMAEDGIVFDEYEWNPKVIKQIGDYFNIPAYYSLFTVLWPNVPYKDGNLEDLMDELMGDEAKSSESWHGAGCRSFANNVELHERISHAQWECAIAYLDWLIKEEANVS